MFYFKEKRKAGVLPSRKERSMQARYIVCLVDFTFNFIFAFDFLPCAYRDQLGKHFQQKKPQTFLWINMLIHMQIGSFIHEYTCLLDKIFQTFMMKKVKGPGIAVQMITAK